MFSFFKPAQPVKEKVLEISSGQVKQAEPTPGEVKSSKRQIHRAEAHMKRFQLAMLQATDENRRMELEERFRYYEGLYQAERRKVEE